MRLFVRNSSCWCQRKHTSNVITFWFALRQSPQNHTEASNLMLALTLEIDLTLNDGISFRLILSTPTIQSNWQIEKCRLIYSFRTTDHHKRNTANISILICIYWRIVTFFTRMVGNSYILIYSHDVGYIQVIFAYNTVNRVIIRQFS